MVFHALDTLCKGFYWNCFSQRRWTGNSWEWLDKAFKSSSQSHSSCMRHSSSENVTLSHKFMENNFKCYLFFACVIQPYEISVFIVRKLFSKGDTLICKTEFFFRICPYLKLINQLIKGKTLPGTSLFWEKKKAFLLESAIILNLCLTLFFSEVRSKHLEGKFSAPRQDWRMKSLFSES